ncbi:M13 family metallopeptidase [Clostridium beijerinckii]|uniref:Neutral endopeptidase n=1 Tax=Clostridium beijerinckii TaxID=1520 RepID=A0A1S8S921_CLOBE|nr:M13 family metallopeptidase [Clostridium beijerinckii]NRY59701.1 putative endopeptidase [Clostridium beijerinckii]OOM61812.1 neutral endopeptidase [Clostridium beijerinckii]
MGKLRIKGVVASTLIFSFLLCQGTYAKAAESADINSTIVPSSLRMQDDFYSAVNREWLNTAKIDIGKTSNSTFVETNKVLTEQKKQIINDLLANEKNYAQNSDEKKIINLYKNTLNIDARNKQGIEPIKEMLEELRNIKTIDDLSALTPESKVESPLIEFSCSVDLKDATKNALYIEPTPLSLGDSDEYVKPTENSSRIKSLTENYYNTVLTLSGYTKEEAKSKVDNLFKFESTIASSIKGKEETSKNNNAIDEEYNVYTLDQLDSLAPNLRIKTIMKNFKVDNANKIILTQPKWFQALNDVYKQENLQMIKDYIEVTNITGASQYLGENFEKAANDFKNALLGSQGDISRDEKAIGMVNSALGEPFGKIYIEKYFSDKVKENVKDMTNEMIETYKKRINNLDWMSGATKERAIEKLDKLNVQIGYPDKWGDYSKLEIRSYENGGSLWENIQNLGKFAYEKSISKLNQPVDKSRFACTPQTINAFYNPSANTITVPAGILQGEFYDVNSSKEKNLGAIGTIIGHEISHAFDNTGAKFDADGNLNNWWSTDDYKKFEEKTNKVRQFYNTVKVDDGKNVNGDLTVGENIADIGGVACALDILKKMPNPDYKAFFESNATMWREIGTKEYEDYKLQYDVHSPNKVRDNIVLAQFDEFYKTYGIKETDKMYVKPEDRMKIW